MTRQKIYYPEMDALKGFAMFLVILGHAIILFPVNLHENAVCLWLYDFIYSFHMPLFFLVSGFLFSFHGSYRAYLWKKARRIAVPYLIFNLLDMIPRSTLGFLFNRPKSFTDSLFSILFHGGEFWFLYTLFFVYVFFPPLAALAKKGLKWKLIMASVLLLWAALPLESIWILDSIRHYLFFFNAGFLTRDFYPSIRERMEKAAPVKIVALSGVLLTLWLIFFSLPTPPQWYKCLISLLLASLGSATVYTLTRWESFHTLFARFGPWTLQLYLLNGWTLGVSRLIICVLLGVRNPAAIILFNMLADFGFSYLIIKYFLSRFRLARYAMGIV